MRAKRIWTSGALLFLGAWCAGCEEDMPVGGDTTVRGYVIDPDRDPIFDVHIGVVYFEDLLTSAETRPEVLTPRPAQETELLPPYPNPTYGFDGTEVTLRIEAATDTTARLEIWSDVYGPRTLIRQLVAGPVSAGTTAVTWDHTDAAGDPLPNGFYLARLTVPAAGDSASVTERSILLSRPAGSIFRRPEYNAFSDPDGSYTLENLPIGEHFTVTSSDGTVVGTGVVRNRVDIVFRELDYQERILPVSIPPGGILDFEVVLQPLALSRTP